MVAAGGGLISGGTGDDTLYGDQGTDTCDVGTGGGVTSGCES